MGALVEATLHKEETPEEMNEPEIRGGRKTLRRMGTPVSPDKNRRMNQKQPRKQMIRTKSGLALCHQSCRLTTVRYHDGPK